MDSVKVLNSQAVNVMLPDGINVTIDPVADVLYIRFAQAPVERTSEEKEGLLIDFGARGNVIGISIAHPKKISMQRRKIFRKLASKHHVPGLAHIHPEHLARGYTPRAAVYA